MKRKRRRHGINTEHGETENNEWFALLPCCSVLSGFSVTSVNDGVVDNVSMPDWFASRFSIAGFVVVVLQQIPGIVWAMHPPTVDPFAKNSGTLLVETLEKTFGITTILLLVVVPRTASILPRIASLLLGGAIVVLAAYYLLYVSYYLGFTGLPILLGMAALPPACFLLVALYQGNYLAIITSLVFGAVHVGLTYANFAQQGET